MDDRPLTVHTDMVLVARAMSRPDSGLEIRDRLWLKITVPRAFIGQSYHWVTLSFTERYRDGAGNTVDDNSSIFSLIRTR